MHCTIWKYMREAKIFAIHHHHAHNAKSHITRHCHGLTQPYSDRLILFLFTDKILNPIRFTIFFVGIFNFLRFLCSHTHAYAHKPQTQISFSFYFSFFFFCRSQHVDAIFVPVVIVVISRRQLDKKIKRIVCLHRMSYNMNRTQFWRKPNLVGQSHSKVFWIFYNSRTPWHTYTRLSTRNWSHFVLAFHNESQRTANRWW